MDCVWDARLLQRMNELPEDLLETIRNSSCSNERYLSVFTQTALTPRYTYILLAYCQNLFAHTCADLRRHGNLSQSLATLGRIVPFAPFLSPYAQDLLANENYEFTTQNVTADDIMYLLGVYRLLRHDHRTFSPLVDPQTISSLLNSKQRPIVYLAIRILQVLLSGSDAWFEQIVMQYLGSDSPDNAIDGPWDDLIIDYRFLSLWEEERYERVERLLRSVEETGPPVDSPARRLPAACFHSSCCLLGSVLLPATQSNNGSPRQDQSLVTTSTISANIERIACGLRSSRPLLLTGLAGAGKTLLVRHAAAALGQLDKLVTLHLNEQSDAKLLVGVYTTGDTPGSFTWRPGVLTTAVQEGRWVFIEDLDRAPQEIIGALLPLIERGELAIPNRKQVIHAKQGFRIIATVRSTLNHRGEETKPLSHMLGRRHWNDVSIAMPPIAEQSSIASQLFGTIRPLLPEFVSVFERLQAMRQTAVLVGQAKTGILRPISPRDLLKWCSRVTNLVHGRTTITSSDIDDFFLEAVDCFVGALPDGQAKLSIAATIAEDLRIDPQRRDFLLTQREVRYESEKNRISMGRYAFPRATSSRVSQTQAPFSTNPHTSRMLERVAAAVINKEPLLLVGETGVGKTTAVQHLAAHLSKKLVPFNLSQQSEAGDLIGGFKPVNARSLMVPLKDEFDELFPASFSQTRNQRFLEMLGKRMARGQWTAACKLFHQALEMVDQQRSSGDARQGEAPTKKRKVEAKTPDFVRWNVFADKVKEMDHRLKGGNEFFAFSFVEGNIVKAVRNGDWILLDEINLASSDTLESIADLLDPAAPSVLLTEAGNVERIDAHPEFRVFAAMNPATDVGKKDLPPGIRSRFTELYVESPDKDLKSLQSIVWAYLRTAAAADQAVALDVSTLYQQIIGLSEQNKLVDGAGQKPHFSLRTLTRTLSYVRHIAPICSLRRALYEGFQMSFLTFMDAESSKLIQPLIEQQLFGKRINVRSELKKALRKPADGHEYAQGYPGSKHWVRQGREPLQEQEHYIITPFIRNNLENLVRASSTRQFPVLIQGPTSSGKTSMIEHLAKRTGHRFVRINNHEHTDLQEYLGTYVSGADGKLQFQEGVLVQALREGHWLVLDELNLAPTDVLEALNRLLDDNRELLIPETQEVVRPHEDFMLFATQNPAGLYGGRKTLSRAFRNRFLELHFDDIPVDELQEILHKRTQLPESRCKRIVSVYRELSVLRQENRLFEQKSFATLRDLFRWALRQNDTIEQLAANGFMLLAERVRKPEEREAVKGIIEKVMSLNGPRVKIDESALYSQQCPEVQQHQQHASHHGTVWTSAMRRLYSLVARAIANNEPVLLVGETGCGKTTVCQMLADALHQHLHIINAHQNTETGDLIGSQRPVRNRAAIEAQLNRQLDASPLMQNGVGIDCHTTDARINLYETALRETSSQLVHESATTEQEHQDIMANIARFKALFEWADGSLVSAMRTGAYFLLDEISLADDSVLERLNSVLEPSRSILLAEKGSLDSFVKAQEGFQFFATMNPGGDYGKRELSPALRNRFTEIWVPALSDLDDVVQIVHGKLVSPARSYANAMVDFAHWFEEQYNTSASSSVSIRDVLAWSQFVNAFAHNDVVAGVVHGAAMVYIDTLGANPAGLMTLTGRSLDDERASCIERLGMLLESNAAAIYEAPIDVTVDEQCVTIGPFAVQRNLPTPSLAQSTYSFDAPTTRANAMRVVRAMQLSKPVMLEGSPGVGKTALVTAIADVAGVPLTRINLSEQTDLMDLFGSDAPVQGAPAGTFAWRDAPFLRAMKNGEWVLLDEMNLASQSVLEGLNACLDHRGEVYVPEIGQTFVRHPGFRLFAAQNPHHQGGGRKGLPASFVNRFTVVYADSFRSNDLMLICQRAFPAADTQTVQQAVRFVEQIDLDVAQRKRFGALGGPWEFNLRDISRWLSLVNSEDGLLRAGNAKDFVDLLFTQRFRTPADRACIEEIFASVYGTNLASSDLYSSISVSTVQLGLSLLTRGQVDAPTQQPRSSTIGLGHHLHALQATMMGVQRSWPIILSGPSGVGKTSIVQGLAATVGASVEIFAMNAETDAMDLVGGYEQADPVRDVSRKLDNVLLQQHAEAREGLFQSTVQDTFHLAAEVRRLKAAAALDSARLEDLAKYLKSLSGHGVLARTVQEAAQGTDKASFVWIDGILVDALRQGKWLVLDNANLCSPSVLDRLNSLLEPNGALIINEHVDKDGAPRVIQPHPNFRIFLTVDPRYGELSRAMRNRALEIHMLECHGVTPLVDPLQPESAIARFRQMKGLGALHRSDAASSQSPAMLQDSIGLDDEVLAARFLRQVAKGLYPGLGSPQELQVAQLDSATKPIAGREQLIAFYELAVSRKQVSADFARVQTLHPLNNQPLVQQSDEAFRQALRMAFLHETRRNAFDLAAAVQRMQSDRTIVSRLMRIERGQHSRGKGASGSVTLQALGSVVRLLLPSIEQLEIAPQDIDGLRAFANWLLGSLRGLLDAINSQDLEYAAIAARLAVASDARPSILMTRESEFVLDIARQLAILERQDSSGWGAAILPLWELLRPAVPATLDALGKLLQLENLVERFDRVSFQFRQPLSSIADVRTSFTKALARARSNNSDIGQLTERLKSIIPPGGGPADTQIIHAPHFSKVFADLSHHFTVLRLSGQALGTSEHARLQALALQPTRLSVSQEHEHGKPDLTAREVLDLLQCVTAQATGREETASMGLALLRQLGDKQNVPIAQLDLLDSESESLGQTVASKPHMIVEDQISSLDIGLQVLVREVLNSLAQDLEDPNMRSDAQMLHLALQQGDRNALQQHYAQPSAPAVMHDLAFAALYVSQPPAKVADRMNVASRAWLALAVAGLRLYLPARQYDPALRPIVRRQVHQSIGEGLSAELEAMRLFTSALTGQQQTLRIRILEHSLGALGPLPAAPAVCRPATSELAQLQMEFHALRRIIEHTSVNAEAGLDDGALANLQQIRMRLTNNFRAYGDLASPVAGFIDCLQISHVLANEAMTLNNGSQLIPASAQLVPFSGASLDTWGSDRLLAMALPAAASQDDTMLWLAVLAARSSIWPLSSASVELQRHTQYQFARLYDKWRTELSNDQRQEATKSSLYRYAGDSDLQDDPSPDQIDELFPTAETESAGTAARKARIHELAPRIVRLHHDLYCGGQLTPDTLLELVNENARVLSCAEVAPAMKTLLPTIMSQLHQLATSLAGRTPMLGRYNVYLDTNMQEIRRLLGLIQKAKARFEELHSAWPDHATPGDVLLLCDQVQAASHVEPLVRRLPIIEKLHSTINEWQKIASREYSAANIMESLTDLIVSWRQLELSSWAGLFDDEDRRIKSDAASWWFVAYETIIAATESLPSSGAEIAQHVTGLLSALEGFFHSSGLGDYDARLEMLRNFNGHLILRSKDGPAFALVRQGLSNFINYFSRFESAVNDALVKGRASLEKEVKDVIQLASWKDRNIETLRQSSKASHRKLFKTVRKYRALLAQPVGPILQSGMPESSAVHAFAVRHMPLSPLQPSEDADVEANIASWKARRARFRHVEATVRLITGKAEGLRHPSSAAERIADFLADVKGSMAELQKATPKLLTEQNKKEVNHLKTRKRRLLAEVLRNVRAMGFQHNLSSDLLDSQASLSQILSQLGSAGLQAADRSKDQPQSHLHQLLQIMLSVREGARKHSDDLTTAEAARCAVYLESMLSLSITQQRAVSRCTRSRSALNQTLGTLGSFATCELPSTEGGTSSTEQSASYSSAAVMLETCAQLIRMQAQLGGKDYSSVYDRIASIAAEIRQANEQSQSQMTLPPGVFTKQQRTLQASMNSMLGTIEKDIKNWRFQQPELGPVLAHVKVWVHRSPQVSASNGVPSVDANGWTAELLDLLDQVLVAVQRLQKALPEAQPSDDEPGWLLRCQKYFEAAANALNADKIANILTRMLERLQHVGNSSPSDLPTVALACRAIQPLVQSYVQAHDNVHAGMMKLHAETTRMAYTLGSSFIALTKEGFCSPPEKSQEGKQDSGEIETGTGLGDGEGGEDISKDVGADEDLSEAAQDGNSKDKEDDIEDEKDAVDMADQDMEGELGDAETASQNDENGDEDVDKQELEEETGDVGDLDDGAVDEKMWDDGKAEQEQEKETDKGKGSAQDKELSAAAEGEKDEGDAKAGENGEAEEEEAAGADEEEVSRKETEAADPHMDQQENLDLPEDMNMDGEKEDKDDFSDTGSMEEDNDDLPAEAAGQDEQMHDAEDDEAEAEPDHKDEAAEAGEEDGEHAQEAGEEAEQNQPEDKMDEDSLLQNKDQDPQDLAADGTVAGEEGTGQDEERDQAQASGGAQQDDNDTDPHQSAQAQQESGKQSGSNEAQDQRPTEKSEQSAAAAQQSAYKKLGDVLDEWYRRQRQIEAPQQSDKAEAEQQGQQDVDMANATFEHLPNADAEADTQALGTASADQSGALNEETSRSVNEDHPVEELPFQENAEDDAQTADANDLQEPYMEPSDQLPPSRDAKAFIGEQAADQDIEMTEDNIPAENESDVNEVDSQMLRTRISHEEDATEMTLEEARRTWAEHESSTRNLALVLTEHLRLILQPTQATKMRGDFRTGKRLNIKRIIPYIASSYKRDKIWMRRSIPSKRSYQIMLAIDDSKSMDESASKSLAFETLALVAKSMSMLEVGELAVLGFGETTKLAHDFSQPFTSEAGAEVFKSFTFAQSKTNVRKLLEDSIELFRSARLKATGSASELWQLQLIISDGVCEDHPSIRQLVRQAHEERIMIVFIVIDSSLSPNNPKTTTTQQQQKQSIVDLQTASFSKDESGEMQLKMVKYLDTFPFRYYLIVRDVQELPGVLAGALRQWFSEVVETGGV